MRIIIFGLLFGLIAAFLIGKAKAADRPVGWRCAIVKKAVAVYGEATALKWAKDHGWSDSKIIEAQKCLGDRNN